MRTVYVNDDTDWDKISLLFDEEYEYIIDSDVFIKSKILLKVEDHFGWDYVIQLPNSKDIVFLDRNSGIASFKYNVVDVAKFIDKVEEVYDN